MKRKLMWETKNVEEIKILSYLKLLHRLIHHAMGFQIAHLKEIEEIKE